MQLCLWPGPSRPVAYTSPSDPASEVTGEAAAALAAASMAFNATDPAYSAVLLNHSMALFNLASDYPGSLHEFIKPRCGRACQALAHYP